MRELTDLQQGFVVAYIEQGGRNAGRCYMIAYPGCTSENSARVTAHRMLRSEKIMAAIREEADKRLRAGALLGASVLIEIAEDPKHKKQFEAAKELLDRAGLIVATHHKVTVEDKRTDDEILERIAFLAHKHGLDPKKLAGDSEKRLPVVQDAEFVEISFEGLEDL